VEAGGNEKEAGVQTAIATVSLSGTLNEKLEAIAKAQFRGVEMFENDLLSFNGTPAEIRRMIEDLGLHTITFQPFRDFEGMLEPQRAKVFARAERKFDVMQELGSDLLLVCSNVSPEAIGGIDRAAADFRELGERAAKRGLRVAFEALAWGQHVNDYRDAWEVVRRADHPSIGLYYENFPQAHTIDLEDFWPPGALDRRAWRGAGLAAERIARARHHALHRPDQ